MDVLQVLLIVLAAATVATAARRLGLSAPLVLVVVGLLASAVPGVPAVELDPDVVLFGFLPPLLYAAAWESSYVGLRRNRYSIGMLSVGLVLFTTVVVGLTAAAVVPGLGLAAAFALGAIVAPPDAVAATAVGRTLGLPRRLVTVLAGESLINDATALTAYRVAVAAAVGGGFSLLAGVREFAVAAAGGALIGIALGALLRALLERLDDPRFENTLNLATPFLAFAVAEEAHVSGVIAVVVAGLYIAHNAPRSLSFATRLQGYALWEVLSFCLESVVFLLIGLQLPTVLEAVGDQGAADVAAWSAVLLLVVIAARYVWLWPAVYLPRVVSSRWRRTDPAPPWQATAVLGWAGMRGVVSLAAAFALPVDFPQRDLIVFLTFVVVIGTLVVQGFTLPHLIRRLGVTAEESVADNLYEAEAQQRAARAALERLDALVAEDGAIPEDVVRRLRDKTEVRTLGAWERLGGGPGPHAHETPTQAYRRLRQAMLEAERAVFVDLRDRGRLDDEVLRRAQRDLDLEEALLHRPE